MKYSVSPATQQGMDGPDPAGDLVPPSWPEADHYPDLPHVVLGSPKEHAYQRAVPRHSHQRTQLLYAVDGVMRVTTDVGSDLQYPDVSARDAAALRELAALGRI